MLKSSVRIWGWGLQFKYSLKSLGVIVWGFLNNRIDSVVKLTFDHNSEHSK